MAKKQKQVFDIGARLKNIKTLYATKRMKEAIAYCYMIYVQICQAKYNEKRLPSMSVRDYAMIMVKKHNQNPANVYPFIQQVESIIYGGRQPSQEAFQNTVTSFGNVFKDVVGKDLPQLF